MKTKPVPKDDDRIPLKFVPMSVFYRYAPYEGYTSGSASEKFARRVAQENKERLKNKMPR